MEGKLYYTADEVAQMVGVGRTKAYGIVKQMNQELKERGYLTVGGKYLRNSSTVSILEAQDIRR